MPEEGNRKNNWFLWLVGISCLITIIVTFYSFYFKKNYNFIVEVACDPLKETCFYRDCSNPDDCPPNGLSDFKRYSLSAADFQKCTNEDCTYACEAGTIKCEPIECKVDEILGEFCSTLSETPTN